MRTPCDDLHGEHSSTRQKEVAFGFAQLNEIAATSHALGVDVSMLKFPRTIRSSKPIVGLCWMAYHTIGEDKRKLTATTH